MRLMVAHNVGQTDGLMLTGSTRHSLSASLSSGSSGAAPLESFAGGIFLWRGAEGRGRVAHAFTTHSTYFLVDDPGTSKKSQSTRSSPRLFRHQRL